MATKASCSKAKASRSKRPRSSGPLGLGGAATVEGGEAGTTVGMFWGGEAAAELVDDGEMALTGAC